MICGLKQGTPSAKRNIFCKYLLNKWNLSASYLDFMSEFKASFYNNLQILSVYLPNIVDKYCTFFCNLQIFALYSLLINSFIRCLIITYLLLELALYYIFIIHLIHITIRSRRSITFSGVSGRQVIVCARLDLSISIPF